MVRAVMTAHVIQIVAQHQAARLDLATAPELQTLVWNVPQLYGPGWLDSSVFVL